MEEVTFRDYEDRDLEWVLAAMVEGMLATMPPEKAATSDHEVLMKGARDDFDRFHYRAQKPEKALLAMQNGERVGFVWITTSMPFRDEEHKAWLLEVYVVPKLRRRGLAKGLMAQAEEWARAHEAEEVWLNVGGGNLNALGLYESQGYLVETMHLCKKL